MKKYEPQTGPPCTSCGVPTCKQTKTGLCVGCYIEFRLPCVRHTQDRLLEFRRAKRASAETTNGS